eukprot:4677981-Pyramimonas_sp.AAC.1
MERIMAHPAARWFRSALCGSPPITKTKSTRAIHPPARPPCNPLGGGRHQYILLAQRHVVYMLPTTCPGARAPGHVRGERHWAPAD